MRCRAAQKLLSRRLDGRLALREARALDAHLARCPACALAAARLEGAWGRLGALSSDARAPDDFGAVLESIAARRGWRGWLESLLPPAPARRALAAALAASVVAGATVGVRLGRAAFAPRAAAASTEAVALSEGFGLLPFGSPAAGLARAMAGRAEGRE